MAINLNPEKSNVTPLNPAAIDAWKKLEQKSVSNACSIVNPYQTIDEKPIPPPNVIMNEGDEKPLAGSTPFNANDAFEIAMAKDEEYTDKELNESIDRILMHVRNSANDGYTETGIDCSFANNGLQKAIKRELKRRGFFISRVPKHTNSYFEVSWGNRIAWNRVLLVIAASILIIAIGCVATCKPPSPTTTQVEKTR
jgi:hypothetical protein